MPPDAKSTGISYLLLGLAAFGAAGIHRFYLGRPVSGVIWFCTWGLFGIGSFVDLFLLPRMVEEENIRLGFRTLPRGDFRAPRQLAAPDGVTAPVPRNPPAMAPEQAILQLAKTNDGCVTVAMVSVETGIALRRAKRALEKLVKDGFAERDVSTEGVALYVFPGLRSNKVFDLDDVD